MLFEIKPHCLLGEDSTVINKLMVFWTKFLKQRAIIMFDNELSLLQNCSCVIWFLMQHVYVPSIRPSMSCDLSSWKHRKMPAFQLIRKSTLILLITFHICSHEVYQGIVYRKQSKHCIFLFHGSLGSSVRLMDVFFSYAGRWFLPGAKYEADRTYQLIHWGR